MSILEVCKCGKTIGLKTEKKHEKEDSDQIFF